MSEHRTSPDAERDLQQIWHFIAEDDPLAADNFIAELLAVFELLESSPRMGRTRDDLSPRMRAHVHGRYIIF